MPDQTVTIRDAIFFMGLFALALIAIMNLAG